MSGTASWLCVFLLPGGGLRLLMSAQCSNNVCGEKSTCNKCSLHPVTIDFPIVCVERTLNTAMSNTFRLLLQLWTSSQPASYTTGDCVSSWHDIANLLIDYCGARLNTTMMSGPTTFPLLFLNFTIQLRGGLQENKSGKNIDHNLYLP